MPWVTISANDVDAKSPITDSLMGDIKGDLDYLKSAISDAGSAAQSISTNDLAVADDLTVGGDVAITGQLTVGSFFVSDNVQNLYSWWYI